MMLIIIIKISECNLLPSAMTSLSTSKEYSQAWNNLANIAQKIKTMTQILIQKMPSF